MNLFQSKKLLLAVVLIILIDQIIQSNLSAINIKRGNFILKQKKFISELYMDEQYFDCISETRRLLYYYPDITYYNEYLYFIDANYFLGKQYRTVINNLKGSDNYNDLKLPYYILLSRSYHNLGLYKDSIRALKQIDYRDLEYTQRFELFIRRIEIYIHNSKYKDALKEIKKSKKNIIENNNDLIILEHEIKQYREIELKSKWLSVMFSSLFPGSGQVYSERYRDGIISFVTVAVTTIGALNFYKKGEKSVSITLGFLVSLFYTGNLYGAYNSAVKTNKIKDNNFRLKLLDKYIPDYHPNDYIDIKMLLN